MLPWTILNLITHITCSQWIWTISWRARLRFTGIYCSSQRWKWSWRAIWSSNNSEEEI